MSNLLQNKKNKPIRLSMLYGALLASPLMANATVLYDAGALDFQSSAQSMWGTGSAFSKHQTAFLGAQWSNKQATLGGIVGSQNAVITPAIPRKLITPAIPRKLITPAIPRKLITPAVPSKLITPAIPAVYVAGVQITPAVPAVYSPYVPAVYLPAIPAVYSPAIPAVYSPYIPAITGDTRTGAQLKVNSSGKVGLEFGYTVDSGSVNTNVKFSAKAAIPDQVTAGQYFNLNTQSVFNSGKIQTQSPKVDAYISAVMNLSGSVNATACGATLGCASGSTNLPTINMNQRILSVDPNSLKILDGVLPGGNPLAEVPILNQTLTLKGAATAAPPTVGFKLTGPGGVTLASTVPPTPAITVDLAEVTASVPDISTSGTKSPGQNLIKSNGRSDFLTAKLDLDGAATLFGGLPPAGVELDLVDAGAFKLSAKVDLIDAKAGPVIGLTQNFELKPTLMANLLFSNPVHIAGMSGLQSSWTGIWDNLPQLSILQNTTVTPTFWTDALLKNNLGLDLGLTGTLDILKLGATASVAGIDVANIGPISLNSLLGIGNTLFNTPKVGFSVFNNQFNLKGFNHISSNPFTLSLASSTPTPPQGPGQGPSPVPGPGPTVGVPEPSSVWLLLVGLTLMVVTRKKTS
jgi:hypothetical protein